MPYFQGSNKPPIDRLTSIYHDVEATLLTTFEELDQFPWRAKTRYWGAWTVAAGKNPLWPNGNGRRIFAYLKDCPALPQILEWLAGCGHSTLAVVDGVDRTLLQKMSAPTLRFERERLDMSLVAKQCDMAVLHGTHGTTASILAAGKPIMQLPIFLDQGLLAHAVHRMGAGAQAAANNSKAAIAELEKLVSSPAFGVAAQRFATKYAGFDPIEATEQLLDEVERVLRLDGRTLN
jgi:O-acetyl-ADP-ribose deacetylase (regulator of RNase III)